jgi:hypothetical protein
MSTKEEAEEESSRKVGQNIKTMTDNSFLLLS